MWTWNAETPARVPAGARISAGKSGNVDRSLPNSALEVVKRSPVSCIPSPESPANRIDHPLELLASHVWFRLPLNWPFLGLRRVLASPDGVAPQSPASPGLTRSGP